MTAGDDIDGLPEGVEGSLCRDPAVEFVVVFGSRVSGTPREHSDLDIAVKFADDLSADERFKKRCHLSGTVQESDAPFVDLSDVDDLSLEFAHAAVNGEFLCGDETSFRRFKREVEAEFERERDRIDKEHRETIDRIAEDGLHG